MLIYHPAFDAYHCVFRLLAILDRVNRIEVDKARILDFYLVFPSAVDAIKLPSTMRHARRVAKAKKNPYRDPISPIATFKGMHQIQSAALRCIAASNLISAEQLENEIAERTSTALTTDVQDSVRGFIERNTPVFEIIAQLSDIPLSGADGLKARTSLLEYRYDAA
jgi:hypothetical protein